MDITKEDIFEAVENKKNWKVNVKEINESVTHIGFTTGRGVWYWFEHFEAATSDFTMLSFNQRYSQNNGKVSRGPRTGFKAEEMIQAAIDPNHERIWTV